MLRLIDWMMGYRMKASLRCTRHAKSRQASAHLLQVQTEATAAFLEPASDITIQDNQVEPVLA